MCAHAGGFWKTLHLVGRGVCGGLMLSLVAACAASSTASPAAPVGAQAPLTRLAAPIELKEGQGGFAGTSGLLWRIEADGAFTVAYFLNQAVQPPHARGQLTPAQLSLLGAELTQAEVTSLPEALGRSPVVNPRITELRYGSKVVVFTAAPEATNDKLAIDPTNPAQARFARLVGAIKAALTVPLNAP